METLSASARGSLKNISCGCNSFYLDGSERTLFNQGTLTPTSTTVLVIYSTLTAPFRYLKSTVLWYSASRAIEIILKSYQHTGLARSYFSARPSLLQVTRRQRFLVGDD